MNGFTVAGVVFVGVFVIFLWLAGMIATLDYVGEDIQCSYGKSVIIGVGGYLAVTIVVLFGIGACV